MTTPLTKQLVAGAIATLMTTTVFAQSSFTQNQTKDIENIVRNYLLNNPELLIEVSQKLQLKAELEKQKQISQLQDTLFNNPDYPVFGNPNGKTVLVEFIDYQCGFCKRQHPIMTKALNDNPDLKLVMLDFPALGPTSAYAAKAALASHQQGKYHVFHTALIEQKGRLTPEKVDDIAESVGVDVKEMKKIMETESVINTIQNTLKTAQILGVTGTPTIIGKGATSIQAGLLDETQLNALIEKARKASQK